MGDKDIEIVEGVVSSREEGLDGGLPAEKSSVTQTVWVRND